MGRGGGRLRLTTHLETLNQAVQAYLQCEAEKASGERDLLDDSDPIPEAFLLLRDMRRARQEHEYWTGGWSAQPYLLYLEFDACMVGESEYQKITAINRRLQEQHSQGKTNESNKSFTNPLAKG